MKFRGGMRVDRKHRQNTLECEFNVVMGDIDDRVFENCHSENKSGATSHTHKRDPATKRDSTTVYCVLKRKLI